MHGVLDTKVFELAIVVRIVGVKHGNETAVASDVDAPEAGVKLDYVRSPGRREESYRSVLIQVEHRD
jgi:hypothetical protein